MLEGAAKLAQSWPGLEPAAQVTTLRHLLRRVELHPEALDMQMNPRGLGQLPLQEELAADASPLSDDTDQPSSISISVAARLRRSGKEVALVIGEGDGARHADTPLARLVARAHLLKAALNSGEASSLNALAQREGMGRTYLIRMLRLAYLAPDVIEAIQAGREPDGLTVNKLMKAVQLPLAWDDQRWVLGLA